MSIFIHDLSLIFILCNNSNVYCYILFLFINKYCERKNIVEEVGSFRLMNNGGFVTRLQFVYKNECGNRVHVDGTGNINVLQSATADPGFYGVPDGSELTLFAYVMAGKDIESDSVFVYRKGLLRTADYTIGGTTFNNQLTYNGIITPPNNVCG
jgi:hypothetical protein